MKQENKESTAMLAALLFGLIIIVAGITLVTLIMIWMGIEPVELHPQLTVPGSERNDEYYGY